MQMDKDKNDVNEEVQNTQEGEQSAQEPTLGNYSKKEHEYLQNEEFDSQDTKHSPSERIKPSKTVNEQFSAVAAAPAQRKLILVFCIIALIVTIYFLFFKNDASNKLSDQDGKTYSNKNEIMKEAVPVPRAPEVQASTPQPAPKLPDIPTLKEPSPPTPPPAPPPLPATPPVQSIPLPTASGPDITKPFNIDDLDSDKQKKLEARRKSGIIVVGSGSVKSFMDTKDDKSSKSSDSSADGDSKEKTDFSGFLGFGNGSFDGGTIQSSPSVKVNATKTEALDRTLLQGKIVHAVLETAINTDIPGTLRALVTRDTYAESGKSVLIPKGSRLIGSYQSSIANGQTRVNVVWDRLIRPDGIDIAIGSAATDQLGRVGVPGDVDTKLFEKLASAFLVSYVIPIAASKLDDSTTTSTTSTTGGIPSVTVTGSTTANAINQGTQQFTQVAKEALAANFPTQPTIIIDQGVRINILVQKDLVFPPSTILNNTVIGR